MPAGTLVYTRLHKQAQYAWRMLLQNLCRMSAALMSKQAHSAIQSGGNCVKGFLFYSTQTVSTEMCMCMYCITNETEVWIAVTVNTEVYYNLHALCHAVSIQWPKRRPAQSASENTFRQRNQSLTMELEVSTIACSDPTRAQISCSQSAAPIS
jgi:hypothetical protein